MEASLVAVQEVEHLHPEAVRLHMRRGLCDVVKRGLALLVCLAESLPRPLLLVRLSMSEQKRMLWSVL